MDAYSQPACPPAMQPEGGNQATQEKRKRSGAYTDAQKQIIKAEIDRDDEGRAKLTEEERNKKRKLGYTAIIKKYPEQKFVASGLRDAMERYRATGALENPKLSGRKRSARTKENQVQLADGAQTPALRPFFCLQPNSSTQQGPFASNF